MARRKKTSPAEDVMDLVAMLPWWGGGDVGGDQLRAASRRCIPGGSPHSPAWANERDGRPNSLEHVGQHWPVCTARSLPGWGRHVSLATQRAKEPRHRCDAERGERRVG